MKFKAGGAVRRFSLRKSFPVSVQEQFSLYRYGIGVPRLQALFIRAESANKELVTRVMSGAGLTRNQAIWVLYYEMLLQNENNINVDALDANSALSWDRSVFGREFWQRVHERSYDEDFYWELDDEF
jgi:hypothetical protein